MRRVRIEKPKGRRKRPWVKALPLDPRDPDVVRAKASAVTDAPWKTFPIAEEGRRG
jgi:hypothetical protein